MGGRVMNFTKYNKGNFEKIEWAVKTDGFSFKKIQDLFSEGVEKVQVFGFFFIKSKQFGLQPIAILNDCLLNLPTHKADVVKEMLADKECVDAIRKGECSLKFRKYDSKFNKECYDADFFNTEKTAPVPAGTDDKPLF